MPGIKYPIPHVPMLGKGSILFDVFDPTTGQPMGFRHLGNATKFELDVKDELAELYQSLNKNVTLIASAVKKRQPKISITGTDFSADHIAIVQMSSGKTTASTSGNGISGETLISAVQTVNCKGRYFRVANMNVDPAANAPSLTQNSIALTSGTDYVLVDPIVGLFYIPLTSSIDTSGTSAVLATYHTLVGSQVQVAGATVPFQQGHLLFVPDPVDGQKIGCDIWRCNLHPNGQLGLIADDYGNWSLEGEILDDTANHPNAPFYQYTFF